MEWIIEAEGAYLCEMFLQYCLRGIKSDQRVVDRHCKVTGCFILFRVYIKLCGQNFIDLRVQYRDGADFGAGKFFPQRSCFFKFSDLLQKLDDH